MATLTTDLSARLWSDGICTRWTAIRGFANSSLVPPLPSFSQRDNDETGNLNVLRIRLPDIRCPLSRGLLTVAKPPRSKQQDSGGVTQKWCSLAPTLITAPN